MKVEEKLREDILFWEVQEREASEVLRYASAVLPRLRESLREIENGHGSEPPKEALPPPPEAIRVEAPAAQASSPPLKLTGDCGEQVLKALAYAGRELVANELMDYLREHGTAFSRGAVDYQLRALHSAGKIARKKPAHPGLKAVWAYCLPKVEPPPPREVEGRALIG